MSWRGYTLREHQLRPADYMACEEGVRALLLFYSVGSGKTLTALHTVDMMYQYWNDILFPRTFIVAPAKVITEVWEPVIKILGLPEERFILKSYDNTRLHYQEYSGELRKIRRDRIEKDNREHTFVIVDESHIIRKTSGKTFKSVFAVAAEADRVLLLTGTPMVNSVEDMESQLCILTNNANSRVPSQYFVNMKTLELMHTRNFATLFSGKIMVHLVPSEEIDYPSVERVVHKVPMYNLQRIRYNDFEKEMLNPTLKAMLEQGIISTALNPYLTRTRAISNTVGKYLLPGEYDTPESSAKFRGIRSSLLEGPKPSVVYSFYLENGILALKKFIDETTDLRTAMITGKTSNTELRRILKEYNQDRTIDVLFMTSAVRQGITLERTRSVDIMEPGWNESLQEQVIGRVVRYRSHHDLPPEERKVKINFWLTTIPRGTSTDMYIYDIAQRKMQIISRFEEILSHIKPPKKCPAVKSHESYSDFLN